MNEHGAEILRAGGMVTNPSGTERLHEYWVHGEGAAKIRWGQPGDFQRCVDHLGKYIRDPKGYCNLAHHAALGFYPATHAKMEHPRRSTVSEPAYYDADGLDGSWDGDLADLPDLTGLGVEHFEAAERDLGMTPPDAPAERMAKLGSGGRFKALKAKLAAKGASDPGALAAYIGRRKFGKAKFAKLAAKARGGSSRAESAAGYVRSFPLEDISVRTTRDGRIVEAYLAVFNTPAEIRDQDGHYNEELDPVVFNRAISDARPQGGRTSWRVGVFYNHGMTIMGTPSDRHSMPVAVPIDIKADGRGVRATDKYHRSQFCDEIVEGLESGAIPGYSFSGRFRRSNPLIPRGGFRPDSAGNLPTVRRMESTLREYGPTPFPAYADAAVLGVRSDSLMAAMMANPDLAMRMLATFRGSAPPDEADSLVLSGAPLGGDSPAEDSPAIRRSGRSVKEEIDAARADFLLRYRR